MVGIDKLKEMFDQTFQAMDAMDNFRAQAIVVMGQNNAMIAAELQRASSTTPTQGAAGAGCQANSAQLSATVKL